MYIYIYICIYICTCIYVQVTITELYVDLSNETVRADLRHRWTSRRLVLKDKSFKKSIGADESLVSDVKGYLTRMSEFENESMTVAELLEWLRSRWQGVDTAERGEGKNTDHVAQLVFDPHRTVDETGQALLPMLHWFRSAYPYYHQRCLTCESDETTRLGTLRASCSEEVFAAGRTELYHCPKCLEYSRFARYNPYIYTYICVCAYIYIYIIYIYNTYMDIFEYLYM